MKTALSRAPEPISIQRGNCHAFKACSGTTLICHGGIVQVTGPAVFIYENVQQLQLALHPGEAYVVEQAGWLHCVALDDARLMCLAPPPSLLSRWLAEGATVLDMQWQKWKPGLHRPPAQPGH